MTFTEYQEQAISTAIYPNRGNNFVYPVLGLAGETGEIAEKVKKIIRDHNGEMTEEHKRLIKKELGDVLWYINALCCELGFQLEDVAVENIAKLQSRKASGKIHGSGDER